MNNKLLRLSLLTLSLLSVPGCAAVARFFGGGDEADQAPPSAPAEVPQEAPAPAAAPAAPPSDCVRDRNGNVVCNSSNVTINGQPVTGEHLSAEEAAREMQRAEGAAKAATEKAARRRGGKGITITGRSGAVIVNGQVVDPGSPGGSIVIDGKRVDE